MKGQITVYYDLPNLALYLERVGNKVKEEHVQDIIAEMLKQAGFWIYGADAGGQTLQDISFAKRTCFVMGSEGNGISRLLGEQCDSVVSIPTCGKIDSLNVSVAAGVLLYERYRQSIS